MVIDQVCGVTYLTKLLLTLCVFAGVLVAMGHKNSHSDKDECAVQHGSVTGDPHNPSDDSHHDDGQSHDGGSTHHHECCHLQNMDQGAPFAFSSVTYVNRLEISFSHTLMPDSPVFSLDKPPLI